MAKKTITYDVCDRCGKEQVEGADPGFGAVKWTRPEGGFERAGLCGECNEQLALFMLPFSQRATVAEPVKAVK